MVKFKFFSSVSPNILKNCGAFYNKCEEKNYE